MKICDWCAIKIRWWRKYCKTCKRSLTGSAGLYLQTGGPPFSQYGRLDPEIVKVVIQLHEIRKKFKYYPDNWVPLDPETLQPKESNDR